MENWVEEEGEIMDAPQPLDLGERWRQRWRERQRTNLNTEEL